MTAQNKSPSVETGHTAREEIFDDFRYLPEPIFKLFTKIEVAVSGIDGKDLCSDNGDGTCTDEGTFFISEDFVPALNALGKHYASLSRQVEELRKALEEAHRHLRLRAVTVTHRGFGYCELCNAESGMRGSEPEHAPDCALANPHKQESGE